MEDSLKALVGRVFIHPVTHAVYGPIRLASPPTDFTMLDGSSHEAFAEDSCGNSFTATGDGNVYFWDHETDELVFLASSLAGFAAHCVVDREEAFLDTSKVVSTWIDPAFAKAHAIKAPEDGWIKKAADHGIKKGSKPS